MRKVFDIYNDNNYYIDIATYTNNNRLYLGISDNLDNLIEDISINLPELKLKDNEIFLNDDLDEDIKRKLIEDGVIDGIYGYEQYNMGRYMKVSLNLDKLKEFDEKGFDEHFNKLNEMER